ncbi:helix-turn-helix transcriptional regulator [Chryseobacterium vrystaatense]|uniref:DNA-binding transcriptional regulator, XRE-family HTH domain n=1 Tax=Chryseobacterium vrystaatense TaxID=307480 RepID=A0A1M5PWV6_9FLAO|nr:helix-turn-helix transcriptional regulator [Chryseobacterium vrystaatense]SHH06150.1 DNA-binding transcriptional regulator, XRE-family HTH domain [Chryseobacterium vrystaatense]
MQKEKLRTVRKRKGYTQQQIADIIATDVSNYSRKESGEVKIVQREWDKIAKFLDVPVDEIYEEEECTTIINNNNSTFSGAGSSGGGGYINTFNNELSISLIKNLQEYIVMLKEEISRLSEKQNNSKK